MHIKPMPAAPTTDPSKMTYPMTAIGNVTVGKAEYASGTVFDANDINTVNFLKKRGAATPYTVPQEAPAEKAGAATVKNAAPVATGEGTNNEADTSAGRKLVGGVRRDR